MKKVYKKGYLIILENKGVHIVKNVKSKKCVVLKSFKAAKTLINLEVKNKLPKNPYFAQKIIKVTLNQEYIKNLKDMIETKVTFKDFEEMVKRNKGIDIKRCQ